MKRISVIAMFTAAVAFSGLTVAGCKKEEGNKPAATEAPKVAAGSATGSAVVPPAAVAPTGGSAAVAPTDPAAVGTPPAGDPAMAGSAAVVPPPAGTPTDAELDAMMTKMSTMLITMADATDKAGDDCGKLADTFDKAMTDNKAFLEEMAKHKDNPVVDQKAQAWMAANKDKMMAPAMKLGVVTQKCGEDAKFKAVMAKFEALN